MFIKILLPLMFALISTVAQAQFGGGGGDGWSMGFIAGLSAADQEDMDNLVTRANTRESGISTGQLGNAWEIGGYLSYRFDGMVAFQLRPSYMFQSEDGSNSSGASFEYSVNAFIISPIFKFYLLENDSVKFFTNVGVAFGIASGEIKEDEDTVDFSGTEFGYMAGLGAEFCFFGSSHCMLVEGNLRFLSVDRVIADSASGDFSGEGNSLSQGVAGQEVELDGEDLGISLSGIQGFVGYIYYF